MTTQELASRMIKLLESCRLVAYWDAQGKVWTIGYGHTKGVKAGMVITQAQANAFLPEDLGELLALVKDKPLIEAAALCSFGYNCGKQALENVLSGKWHVATYGRTSNNIEVPSLGRRRDFEDGLILASREMLLKK